MGLVLLNLRLSKIQTWVVREARVRVDWNVLLLQIENVSVGLWQKFGTFGLVVVVPAAQSLTWSQGLEWYG